MSKADIVAEFGRSVGDTGSPEVQVAVFTQRILLLTDHLKRNAKDHHSRRGLKMLVGQRQGQLQYLKQQSQERYESLIGILGLRR